jgi:TonB family protein
MKTPCPSILILACALACVPAAAAQPASAPADTVLAAPDVEPELLFFAEADYPPDALRAGREGTVLLEMLVTVTGAVDSVLVAESPDPDLAAAAVDAARRCTFSPAMAAGAPVPVWLQFAYTFSVAEQARAIDPRVNLQGRLKEMGTRQPIADAMVVASFPRPDTTGLAVPWDAYLERVGGFAGQYREGDRLVTFTDSTGVFTFRALPAGLVDLTFPNAGYEPLQVSETVRPGELIEGTFRLRRSRYHEYEIVVYGREEETEVTRSSLSVAEVELLPGFGGDVIKSVQALPGVARPTMDNPGAVVVRGSGNYDTRFFIDGIDMPLLFHFGGVKSTYNSLSLGSVDLYPGGFGTRYGGAIGGVVEIKGRPGRLDRWRTVLDASLLDASFHTEGPLGRNWSLMLSARRSFAGEITKWALDQADQDDVSMTVAPYYWDAVGRLDWDASDDHHFFLTTFAAGDRLELVAPKDATGSPEVSEATDEVELDLSFDRFILGWDGRLGDRAVNELRAAWGHNTESGHVGGDFRFEGSGPVLQLRDDLAYRWRPEVVSHLGLDLATTPYKYEVKANGWPASSRTVRFSDLGTYANVELRPRENLLIIPGLRYDHYDHIDQGRWSVRSSVRWGYAAGRTLTAAYGTYNQMPQPAGQSTDPVYGNPDLPPTTARHATLGHEWRLNDRLFFKVEGYHNTQDRIPAIADTLDANFLPDAEGRMHGLEFMLRHENDGRFFGWISYSLGRSERRFARRPSLGLSDWNPDRWYLHDMDQTHHLEAVGSWRLGNDWSFGSRLQYVSGVPRTPIQGYTGNRDEFDADTGSYVPVEGEYFSDRMDPYVRVDLRIDKKWVKDNSIWSVYLDLQNANYFVYNSPEGYTYNYDYTKRTSYGWIFLPALGARVEF